MSNRTSNTNEHTGRNTFASAALKDTGEVVTWVDVQYSGDSSVFICVAGTVAHNGYEFVYWLLVCSLIGCPPNPFRSAVGTALDGGGVHRTILN
jgi:hypothetical protein